MPLKTRVFACLICYWSLGSAQPPERGLTDCHMPWNVSADSMVRFTLSEYKRRFHKSVLPNSDEFFRIYYYDETRGIKYDEAFRKTREHLVRKLGAEVFCRYVYLTMNSFTMKGDSFILKYYFLIPGISLDPDEKPNPWFDTSLQDITFKYRMLVQKDGSLKISYPSVPDCHGLPDCGIKVTRAGAYSIVQELGWENPPPLYCDTYEIRNEGMYWIIERIEGLGGSPVLVKQMRVHMQTGERSAIKSFSRINPDPGCPD
jgi:hypothetical protein